MSNIKVHWATFGTNENAYLVTSRVQQLVDQGYEKVQANEKNFGDPQPGYQYQLAVQFELEGEEEPKVAACVYNHTIAFQ